MNRVQKLELMELLEEKSLRSKQRKLFSLYPDDGPLRRELYTKHLEFFEAGKTYLERGAIAANRTGKTTMSMYETTLHLTGLYPDWWPGRRFDHPVDWWCASDTGETTRDILQFELLGPLGQFGTGMIPKRLIVGEPSHRRGVSGAIDTIHVRHKSGGISQNGFKSYDQGREKFQGTKKHGVSLDEEPDAPVYFECLTRVASTNLDNEDGLMICTFTPLKGMSTVVLLYLNEKTPTRFHLTMGFDHVPHLSPDTKAKLIATYPPHERDARTKGIPQLGAGAIYPVPESEILIKDFPIPDHWPRGYGLDVGWKKTSAGFWALDRDKDCLYRYSEHYQGQQEPSLHAAGIKTRGEWLHGVFDPAARGRAQHDGQQLSQMYKDLGLNLHAAKNAVEAGIYETWQRMSTGRLKVFGSCQNWFDEFRLYHRDENGKIVKERDHAMDDTRYMVMSGIDHMKTKPNEKPVKKLHFTGGQGGGGWMG